jgi:hypothetical protein
MAGGDASPDTRRDARWPDDVGARIGVLQALHRNEVHTFNPDRKDPHWGAEAKEG